ncbi:hypothetical protein [Candidatus Hakubella thermalkaliphila]|uniref:hypothetical protein n=1 Tax=Candidatus Hakubella thermalkaliphila TaxID=2754717 RepID=UPI0015944F81|nr:hypothetical protein [Candidatus Hakubella thermalkaliphila]
MAAETTSCCSPEDPHPEAEAIVTTIKKKRIGNADFLKLSLLIKIGGAAKTRFFINLPPKIELEFDLPPDISVQKLSSEMMPETEESEQE